MRVHFAHEAAGGEKAIGPSKSGVIGESSGSAQGGCMTLKKERAGIIAMVMYAQMILVVFVISASLARDVGLGGVVLPLVIRAAVLTMLVLIGAIVAYFLVPKKKRSWFILGAFGFEILAWALAAVWMGLKGVFGVTEFLYAFLVVALLVIGTAIHTLLAPKKEKGNWARVRVMASLEVIVFLVGAFYVVLHFRNDIMRTDVTLLMFVLCAVSLLCFWWCSESVNHVLTLVIILLQVISYIVCFGKLCANKEQQELIGVVLKSKNMSHILTMLAMLLVFLLAVAVLLQYLKNLQVIGKYASISFTCIVIGMLMLLGSLQDKLGDAAGIDSGDAVTTEEYCLYVPTDDPAQELSDAAGYTIAYGAEGRTIAMAKAVEALGEKAGTTLTLRGYNSRIEAAEALRKGEVKAVFIEGLYVEILDAAYEAMEMDVSFTGSTRSIFTLSIPAVPDDPEPTEEPDDPNATPTPTIKPGEPTPTPDPFQPAEFKERPDNSGIDLTTTPFTVLLSGIDTYGGITARSRSDVNLLMCVNPVTKEIAIVTTPRDAYVHIPGKTKKLRDKLTHAGIYGPQYSMATLEHLYSVPVDFYVRVNFSSVVKIVDVLGGVDANSLYTFTSEGGYQYRKGLMHMNGSQALAFVRERHNVPGGDYTRGKHQIEVIKGLINKVTSSKVLTNYESFLNTLSKSFQTDITVSQIAQLATMQSSDGANWHITSYETVASGDWAYCDAMPSTKLWVASLDVNSIAKSAGLMRRVLNGEYIQDGEYKYDK